METSFHMSSQKPSSRYSLLVLYEMLEQKPSLSSRKEMHYLKEALNKWTQLQTDFLCWRICRCVYFNGMFSSAGAKGSKRMKESMPDSCISVPFHRCEEGTSCNSCKESPVPILSCLYFAKMCPAFTVNSFCVTEQHLFVLPLVQTSNRIALPPIFYKETTCGFVDVVDFWEENNFFRAK